MTFDEIRKLLKEESDKEYAAFNGKITPSAYPMIGVQIPKLRKIAKEADISYLDSVPAYFEEVILHGLVLGNSCATAESLFSRIPRFLSFVDNWAAIDVSVSSMKAFKKDGENCYNEAKKLLFDDREYHARFGAVAFLDHYIDEKHVDEILRLYSEVKGGRYYVDMAVAWGLSVAAVRFFDKTADMIESGIYPDSVSRKALGKCLDSFRLSAEQKQRIREIRKKQNKKPE